MSERGFDTCSLCPRLCRHACPVASGSAREASVPTAIASVLREHALGRISDAIALEAATLCTDCGACTESCHLHVPLPKRLRAVRSALLPPVSLAALSPVQGSASLVAIEADSRPFASVLARVLGREVSRWTTTDQLGCQGIEANKSGWDAHGATIRAQAQSREVVVIDGGVAEALRSAGVPFIWAWTLVGSASATGSCAAGGARPAACCGGAGPLARHHPEDAVRTARRFHENSVYPNLLDARCRNHLRQAGVFAKDWLDLMLQGEP